MASEDAAEARLKWAKRRQAVPLDLKIVALVFVFSGAAALFEMVIGLVQGSWLLDLNILCLPAGLGLLRLRPNGLALAIVYTGLCFVVMAAGGLIVGALEFTPLGALAPDELTVNRPVAAVVLWVLLCALGLWVLGVLTRPKVRALFRSARKAPRRLSRGERAVVCLAVVGALLLSLAGAYPRHEPELEQSSRSTVRDGRLRSVHYGHRAGKLAYAVFRSEEVGALHGHLSMVENKALFCRPDGSEIELPGEHLLYEVIDGKLQTSDEPVTLEEFQAFVQSSPEQCSIDALLSSAEQQRANARAD